MKPKTTQKISLSTIIEANEKPKNDNQLLKAMKDIVLINNEQLKKEDKDKYIQNIYFIDNDLKLRLETETSYRNFSMAVNKLFQHAIENLKGNKQTIINHEKLNLDLVEYNEKYILSTVNNPIKTIFEEKNGKSIKKFEVENTTQKNLSIRKDLNDFINQNCVFMNKSQVYNILIVYSLNDLNGKKQVLK